MVLQTVLIHPDRLAGHGHPDFFSGLQILEGHRSLLQDLHFFPGQDLHQEDILLFIGQIADRLRHAAGIQKIRNQDGDSLPLYIAGTDGLVYRGSSGEFYPFKSPQGTLETASGDTAALSVQPSVGHGIELRPVQLGQDQPCKSRSHLQGHHRLFGLSEIHGPAAVDHDPVPGLLLLHELFHIQFT